MSGPGLPPRSGGPAGHDLRGVIHELRAPGFFVDPAPRHADVAADVAELLDPERREPAPGDGVAELEIAHLDEGRVWWADSDADVAAGRDASAELVTDLARISRGALRPMWVEERWAGELDPIRLTIGLPDGTLDAEPRGLDDDLDIEGRLPQLHAVPKAGSPRFELSAPFDQTAAIVYLKLEERRQLEARGWSYADLGGPPGRE